MSEETKSWRDVYKVHPAADIFPLLDPDELRQLGNDIVANGMQDPIALWSLTIAGAEDAVVLDGRNRLDSMELVGMETLQLIGDKYRLKVPVVYLSLEKNIYAPSTGGVNPLSYTISKNIHRRHLRTKEQQAELIVKVMNAPINVDAWNHLAKMAKTVKRGENGKIQGSVKDPVKEKIVNTGAELGIGKRTMERAIADYKGPTHKNPRVQTPRARSNGKDETIPYSPNISNYAIDRIAQKCIQLLVHEFRNLKQSDVEQVLTAIAEHFAPNAVEEIF